MGQRAFRDCDLTDHKLLYKAERALTTLFERRACGLRPQHHDPVMSETRKALRYVLLAEEAHRREQQEEGARS